MPIQLPSSITISRATSSHSKSLDSPPTSPTARPELKFNDQNDNFHRVEFDAPSSSSPQPFSKGRFSIDLSMELERQLAGMESPPETPVNTALHAGRVDQGLTGDEHHGDQIPQEQESLLPDPEILSHIVTQLRHSLASLTQERDTLVQLLAKKTEEEASVKDALEIMVERATKAEEELSEARRKIKEDEEQIGLLRGKVEESRRGLMRLQTESRRQSAMITPIDVNRASAFTNAPLTSASSKRASFTPLTGSRHGRISSITDVHSLGVDGNGVLSSPISLGFSNGEAGLSPNQPYLNGTDNKVRRISGLFGRHSPTPPSGNDGSSTASDDTPIAHPISAEVQQELESLKAQVKSLKTELEAAKRDVMEANEAREASEMCVQTLRRFINENGVGIRAASEPVEEFGGGAKLPPPPPTSPPMMGAEGDEEKRTSGSGTNSGWGFTKLWGSSSGPGNNSFTATSTTDSTITRQHTSSPPSVPTTAAASASASAAPLLSRKLTGLFGSRSSRSSGSNIQSAVPTSSGLPAAAAAAPLPPAMLGKRDSTSNNSASTSASSDVSSVIEPLSPAMSGSGLVLGGQWSQGGGLGFGSGFGSRKMQQEIMMEGKSHGVGEKGLETPALSLHEIELDGPDGLR